MFKRFVPVLFLLAACTPSLSVAPATRGATAAPSSTASATPTNASTRPSADATVASATPASQPENHGIFTEEGCEHMAESSSEDVQANLPSMSRTPGQVSLAHKRFDVQLVTNGNGQNEGYVVLNSDVAKKISLFMNREVPIKLEQDGKEIAFIRTQTTELGCDVLKAAYEAPVAVGPVQISFGPTAEENVSIVLELAEAADDR